MASYKRDGWLRSSGFAAALAACKVAISQFIENNFRRCKLIISIKNLGNR